MTRIRILAERRSGTLEQSGNATALIIAGWTGRDVAAVERHVLELEAIGVARPKKVPVFYRVSASLLSQREQVEVLGTDSSGEAEPVVICLNGNLWLGVGSDHTDRHLETVSVAASKQACPKPLGRSVWPLAEVQDHWDDLVLRSFITSSISRELYQEGELRNMRPALELIQLYSEGAGLEPGTVMFCGTLPVQGALRGSLCFELELEDPILGRALRHSYHVTQLPMVS